MGDRHYENNIKDYGGEDLVGSDGKLIDKYCTPLKQGIEHMLERLYTGLENEDDDNYSVYTGIGGIALLHLRLYSYKNSDRGQLECALDCLKPALKRLKGRRISFLCGDAGPLALGAVVYSKLGNTAASVDCIKRLEALHKAVCEDPSLPDELLYGRVGYMYALLLVRKHCGNDSIHMDVVLQVFKCVIDSGLHMSQQQRWKHPLMYAWHDKHYLGAAHGLAGIYYMLMQVSDSSVQKYIQELVRPSLEWMLTLQFPSGNCPSSLGSSTGDKLVHWCHGAPGWIHTFVEAYKLFGEDRYLQAAVRCADVIWERGLLRKGHGICHGTTGNAYAFLAMYQLTDDKKYLHRAYEFGMFCIHQRPPRIPDAPYSMFEGLAGTIYFLVELLTPSEARFPAFAF
ncbi:lanC-like protein 2 isoform X2 [Mya arenaria]|uniref:lanC-like protein 2 isoform X2 n=1 Tax=Mya arenaria TaxID=6604 RepID=UPI0022E47EFB|nr:lanC-like protein 2 isoform X2 [Mya arenaria]